MNLRSVDLNLLVALDALLAERSVTRAADRLGLSQPATSNALGRLRRTFRDDLLVRTPTGMQPTPHAEALREPLRHVLRQIERVLETEPSFDPARTTATLAVRMSDLLGSQLLPPLLTDLRRSAPGISLDIVHLSPTQTIDALDRDEVHVAVSMSLDHSGSIRSEPLFPDRMVCVMRRDHPLSQGRLTLDGFLEASHLKVSMSPTDRRFVDDILRRAGRSRTVVANVPHWLLVPQILRTTDLIAVMPGRYAASLGSSGLVQKAVPFRSAPFDWRLYRHGRHEGNAMVRWLCERLHAAAHSVA